MAALPVSDLEIIRHFGPHRAYATGSRLDAGLEPDKMVKTHC
jgi:assimilatory nitrate reductase catalytic subunit